ncbi:MAG: hypothetical protein QXO75_02835 [Nitrososphaerota archaeon]
MKMGNVGGLLISLVIIAVISFALLLTGIWYAVIVAGIVGSLLIRKGYLVSVISSILGGIISVIFVFFTLPMGNLLPMFNEVGAISGIGAPFLIALMLLITAALALSGSLVGTFIVKNALSASKRSHSS